MTRGVRRLARESHGQSQHYPSGRALQVPDVPASYKARNARILNGDASYPVWIWGRSKEVQELQSPDLRSFMRPQQKHARAHLFGGDAGGLKPAIANDGSGVMTMPDADVLIAGAGPTGLMLAGELALAGVDVAIVERRASQHLAGLRAGGLHSRTIEVLDQRGIADRFLSQGQTAQVAQFAGFPLDISDFPTRHNYGLGLWQNHIERILAGWVDELAVPIYRGREVTGFAQDDTGVDVELGDGQSLRTKYLVGCDGGRSLIRKAAGIEFPGSGSDDQQPDRRGRDGGGTGNWHPPRRPRHPFPQQVGRWRAGAGLSDRTARRRHDRTHPARSQRGAHRRVRDRLWDPQSHLDLQVHRHDSAGRGLPQGTGSCLPATPHTCIPRTVDRASRPVCRMR